MPRPLTDWRIRIRRFFDEGPRNQCWPWKGAITKDGYGSYRMGGKGAPTRRAHRAVYVALVGPIPDGKQWHVDHLCRNTVCVNPAHLEVVHTSINTLRGRAPSAVNARKTHCPQGHPYDVTYSTGGRCYRACRRCRALLPSSQWSEAKAEAQRARRARRRNATEL